ncbi:MAG TPA: ABC transporter transmembrane domain-containing protein [Hypericibacter adhaerens]|jgi:ATP-binding cassette subfamily B protein|uniref:ABC transporter n=1 Tax=Hypericibacter adhaerens TaxID=2602016 RepID=A0A5J6N9B2_9PROT|nr:ABC transporter transmembrane domain-containing protein [Hypericibacter adhaerens]QEX24026.1 ABC transporter [Hypericibacter adhaerens]HWA44803.1 ABC transporter transmembrane domain-containing protein [Hypericibacter adhaerens]
MTYQTSTSTRARDAGRPGSRKLGTLWQLARFLRPYKLQLVGASIALIVAAFTVLGLGQGLRSLIDSGFGTGDTTLLDKAVILMIGVTALLAVATYARYSLVSWVGERVVADVRRAVFDHVVTLSPTYFETTRAGEVLSRLTTDTTLLQVVVGSSVSVALRNGLMFLGGAAMLAITSAKLTGLVFLVVPLVILPIVVFGRMVRKRSRATQDQIAAISAEANEVLQEIRIVQAFNHEAEDRRRFGGRVEATFQTALSYIRARALLTALVIFLVFGAISVILWIGGHDVLAGRISAGQLSAFVFYAVVVAGSVGSISEVYGDLQRAAGAMERLSELLQAEPEIRAPSMPVALPEPPQGRLAFENLRFFYPSRPDRAALDHVSFTVEKGETVALVGPSGAGKTTLFQLLLRFYDPQEGAVRLDGIDLRQADPAAVRARLGLVPQEPVIFSGSMRENIRYGRPGASDEEVEAAAEAAYVLEFARQLPQGLDTELGERGVRLSGGQRQRVAIARAILRDPAVLLLDEATSALDAESERRVQEALEKLMTRRTTLVIAHRLATVLKADRIVVLDQGRVVATGSHADLMRMDGLYKRLATLQFDQPLAAAQAARG